MNIQDYVQALVDLVDQAPLMAAVVAFAAAAGESVAILGMIVPGFTVLIALGGLAGLGDMSMWPLILGATLGAIVGDGVSYWIGWRFKHRIRRVWPLSRRPELLEQADRFFLRHGAMSVAIARFLPAMRSLVPAAAGTFSMPACRFYLVNILSAIVWAPAHIVPPALATGMLAGMGERGDTLAALVVAVIAGALILAWLGSLVFFAVARRR